MLISSALPPEGRHAVLMPRIPASMRTLAQPPSFESCTRDIYPSKLNLSLEHIRTIMTNLAGALAHMHNKSVSHGDLYGHNLQIGPNAEVLLGDFGAATCYQNAATELGLALMRIELRALGHLFSELMNQCAETVPSTWRNMAENWITGGTDPELTLAKISITLN